MKHFKFIFATIGLLFFSLPLFAVSAASNQAEGKELILIWNASVSKQQQYNNLQTDRSLFTIIEQHDDFMLIRANDCQAALHLYHKYSKNPDIAAIDYNTNVDLCYSEDPYSATQWSLYNPGYYSHFTGEDQFMVNSTKGIDLNLYPCWNLFNKENTNTNPVTVAIIDTGVDFNHPDLKDAMWTNPNEIPEDGIDNDHNGYIDDIFGWDFYNNENVVCHYSKDETTNTLITDPKDNDDHGTHCAGIIAATANNQIGIAGVASNIDVKIMSLKIHGGKNGKGSIADAILAIKYAATMNADIVNMSWGTTLYNEALKQVMKQSSMLFVTAAGNNGGNNDTNPIYPASYNLPNIISVTFINEYGSLTDNSNYGKKSVDLAAPGMHILSTTVGSSYKMMSGSSMAAPHVTGLAAILKSCSKKISPDSIRSLILNTSHHLPELDEFLKTPGIPDAYQMILSSGTLMVDEEPPKITVHTYYKDHMICLGVYAKDTAGSGIRTLSYLSGNQTVSAFRKGYGGIPIEENSLHLKKAGTYTFYSSDYSGNETILVYQVADDIIAPIVTIQKRYPAGKHTSDLILSVIDDLSGIHSVRFTKGSYSAEHFHSNSLGTELTLSNGSHTIQDLDSGDYTIYVSDNRGNQAIYPISLKNVPITKITCDSNFMSIKRTELKKLNISCDPATTTDRIYYTSSNPSVVTVNQWGTIFGKRKGRAAITIHSTSGVQKKIIISVT